MPNQIDAPLKSYQQTPRSHTTSFTLTGSDANKTHTNLNATGSVTLNLPRATPNISSAVNGSGLEFRFLCVNANAMVIQPISTDTIRGNAMGASTSISGAGTGIWLVCAVPGYWDIVNSGGSSSQPFNIGPDLHTNTPGNVANDEFESGSGLDTAGTRFSGAIPWTVVYSQNSNEQFSISAGNLVQTSSNNNVSNFIATQPITSPSAAFSYTAKMAFNNAGQYRGFGLYLYNSSNGLGVQWSKLAQGSSPNANGAVSLYSIIQYQSAFGFVSNAYLGTALASWTGEQLFRGNSPYYYLQIRYDGTFYTFAYSVTGVPGTFIDTWQMANNTLIGAVGFGTPNQIGILGATDTLYVQSSNVYDWFRRTL